MLVASVVCQLLLLAYHQTTTLLDLHPFNGVRNAVRAERLVEAAVNAVLMALAPIGYIFGVHALQVYGVIYYFVLLFFEVVIWWIPYLADPSGRARRVYNVLLAVATMSYGERDALADWTRRHRRLHAGTVTPLPAGRGPITPNLEHMILHALTVLTAVVTAAAFAATR